MYYIHYNGIVRIYFSDNGKVLKLKEVCASFTTDMIGSTAFGLRVNSLEDNEAPFRQFGKKMFDFNDFTRINELFHIFFMPSITKYTGARFFSKEGGVFLRSIFWDMVDQRIASGEKRNDLIDILIEMQRAHENEGDLGGFSKIFLQHLIPFKSLDITIFA